MPLIVIAGKEYGTGSSRDWAAKGTLLLGVRAVIAESFERIHRSNLVGMGVLPLEFTDGATRQSLGLTGFERYDIDGMDEAMKPRALLTVHATASDGTRDDVHGALTDRHAGGGDVLPERRHPAVRAAEPRQAEVGWTWCSGSFAASPQRRRARRERGDDNDAATAAATHPRDDSPFGLYRPLDG